MRADRIAMMAYRVSIVGGLLIWAAVIFLVFAAYGCSDPMTQGIAIGVGASAGAEETQKLAAASKEALIAEVLRLREEIKDAATPEEQAALQEELNVLEEKQKVVEMTESITNKVSEGLQRDWESKDPQKQVDNWMWIAGLAVTIFYGAKKTLDANKSKKVSRGLVHSTSALLNSPQVADKDKAKAILAESQGKAGIREEVRSLL